MAENPIDLVLVDGVPVSKASARGFEKLRGRQRVADANEIRNTKFSGQFGGLYRADAKTFWDIDTEDTTTADDGINCVIDADGNRWKPVSSVPAPTEESLGGVFSKAPEDHKFLTGIDTDGTPLSARPDVTDLTGVDPDPTLAENSDDLVASQKAAKTFVQTYVAAYIAAQDVEVLKGAIDCSSNPDYPAADAGHVYRVSVAGKIGGASGPNVEIGDRLECFVDETPSGDHAAVGANWIVSQVNIDGAVVGPASSVDGELALFNGTGGRQIKRAAVSGLLKAASGVLSAAVAGTDYIVPSGLSGALDLLGSTRGAILYRGAAGWAVLAPGTNGQVLTTAGSGADPSWQDSTGGGSGLSDTDRRNILLDRIYQSKALSVPRRVINSWADGYKSSAGINAGSSSNYNVDTSSGFVSPTMSGGGAISGGTGTNIGDMTAGGGLVAAFDGTTSKSSTSCARRNSVSNAYVGKNYSAAPKKIASGNIYPSNNAGFMAGSGVGNITITLYAKNGSSPSSGTDGTSLGSITVDESLTTMQTITSSDATTTWDYVWFYLNAATDDYIVAQAIFVEAGTPANMTVVTTVQATDASVSSARVLVEFDNSATPTLNTDLTVEVTCDGGANWAAATLSSITSYSQGGRTVAETADTTCISGTSFAARIKTANGKNVPVYGVSTTVH